MPKPKSTKHEDDVRRNLRKSAEINPAQSPHDGIHTCSKGCKKPGCNRGLRDTIEEQDAQIEALKQDLLEQTAAVRHLRMERVHDLNHIGSQQEEIADLRSQFANSEQENARLKAEVERLRKAGDAMATNIPRMVTCQVTAHEAVDFMNDWNAAKEGKQS